MKYAGIIENDFVNGEGVSTTLFLQGCPHHCMGCHNPETWDFNGGIDIQEDELIEKICIALQKNGIQRNLSISGGEPLCDQNLDFTKKIIRHVKSISQNIKITIWTGFNYTELLQDLKYGYILSAVDLLITGPFLAEERDISLPLRGSKNQEIRRRSADGTLILSKN